jgi:hypothetical protein
MPMLRGVSRRRPTYLGGPTGSSGAAAGFTPGMLRANRLPDEEFWGSAQILSPPMRRYATPFGIIRAVSGAEEEFWGSAQILHIPAPASVVVVTKLKPGILYANLLPEPEFTGWATFLPPLPKHIVPAVHIYWLPDATTCGGKSVLAIEVNNSSTYATIFKSLGGKVNNAAAGTGYTFTTISQLGSVTFTSDGVNWWITGLTFS